MADANDEEEQEMKPGRQPETDPAPEGTDGLESHDAGTDGMPRLLSPLRPGVDLVARLNARVHVKLVGGLLVGALLLLGMGVLSLPVISQMNQRVGELTTLQEKVERSQQAIYLVTAQSHYRAMALLTGDEIWNDQIAGAKEEFVGNLDQLDGISPW